MGLSLDEALGLTWTGINALARGFNELSARQAAPQKTAEDLRFEAGLQAAEKLASRIAKTGVKQVDTKLLKGI